MPHVHGVNDDGAGYGVEGENPTGPGVIGLSTGSKASGFIAGTTDAAHFTAHAGVFGESDNLGVYGSTTGGNGGTGVYGNGGNGGFALRGDSTGCKGFIAGTTDAALFLAHAGVYGESDNFGVAGYSTAVGATGVFANVTSGDNNSAAVRGFNTNGSSGFIAGTTDTANFTLHAGVFGESDKIGVYGVTTQADGPGTGVYGNGGNGGFGVRGESTGGTAVQGKSFGAGGLAGRFEGDVEVTGDIRLSNQDCAEDFDVSGSEEIQPGTVMVIANDGSLHMSQRAYDKRVAGVISGAGNLKPGIILGKQESKEIRMPLALLGKAYCKVDASCTPIEVGDLLTTSPVSGHAMKAVDPLRAFGAVIGKALRPLNAGQGLIPILIALQ